MADPLGWFEPYGKFYASKSGSTKESRSKRKLERSNRKKGRK